MPIWISLLLITLAVARGSKLISSDFIGQPLRKAVVARNGEQGWFTFLVHCPWCISMWLSFAAAPFFWWFAGYGWSDARDYLMIMAIALAMSFIASTPVAGSERLNG